MIVKYGIVCDPHLCDGTAADQFGKENWKDFYNLIKSLWQQNIMTILDGDFLELLQTSFEKIMRTYPEAMNVMMNSEYVAGNHDWEVKKYLHKTVYERLELCDGQVLVLHGHQFDKINICRKWLKIILTSWAVIERIFGKKISTWIQKDSISPSSPNYIGDKSEYRIKAKELARKGNYKILINGHTHSHGIFYDEEDKERRIIDGGTCQGGHLLWVLIEYDTELKKIINYDLKFVK
jgi:predicted phosphodiesterase